MREIMISMMSTCLEKIDEGHWTLPAATITWIRVLALLLRRVETSRAVQGRCYRRGIVVVQRATTGSVWSLANGVLCWQVHLSGKGQLF
mmetsp:Transcript_27731/g.85730  ORF Transcript_27731/g.85730 Transcript_27731/m.85730 type:complete len:89 (+) Transcript_27731:1182-1448(+)